MEFKEIYHEANGMKLHGYEGPQAGPALVLLHGATSNCYSWMGVTSQLSQHWHVYAFDLRGHGLSGRPADLEGYNLLCHADDTVTLLRDVVQEPAVLVGHSYGAVTAALAGKPGADWLRGVVLEDPPMHLRRVNTDSKLDYFKWVYEIRQTAQTVDEIIPILAARFGDAPPGELQPFAQSLAWLDPNYLIAITHGDERETARGVDFEAHVRGITCPVLVMQADLSMGAALMPQDLDWLMANLRDARLATFPGSGHGIHSDQPDEFLKAIDDFAGSLP